MFQDPFTVDVTRSPNHHLAFGHGTHFCIGANFARRELEILFGKLTREWTDLRVISASAAFTRHHRVAGW